MATQGLEFPMSSDEDGPLKSKEEEEKEESGAASGKEPAGEPTAGACIEAEDAANEQAAQTKKMRMSKKRPENAKDENEAKAEDEAKAKSKAKAKAKGKAKAKAMAEAQVPATAEPHAQGSVLPAAEEAACTYACSSCKRTELPKSQCHVWKSGQKEYARCKDCTTLKKASP